MLGHPVDDTELDILLKRIINSTLLIIALIVALLIALLVHFAVLQTAVAESNSELFEDMIELQESAQGLQIAVEQLNDAFGNEEMVGVALDSIDRQLEIIDENLDMVEQNIELISPALEDAGFVSVVPQSVEDAESFQRNIKNISVILGWVISGLGIAIAAMFYLLLNTRQRLRLTQGETS